MISNVIIYTITMPFCKPLYIPLEVGSSYFYININEVFV